MRRDRTKEIQIWANRVRKVKEDIPLAILIWNNHYMGFGPGSANMFSKIIELPEVVWEEMKQSKLV
jgi:hypothetical protein